MKVEAVHQLAVALKSSPRLYACLLGSGVSRAAGVPTGWEVLLDLVRKHARMLDEHQAADADPAQWFARRHGEEPDYSNVVQALAPTSALRRNLLESYFTVQDAATNQQKEHEPTPTHRAIARLVKQGALRVIVTTNFDRLMENALRDEGLARIEIVSSEQHAANCYPFHASEAFVFKIHGDWRDLSLRNSRDELAQYPEPLAALLKRIIDEHGLIVCGWSAEYDVALREAIFQHHRRFPVYWIDPKPGEQAEKICESLRATVVRATADTFFEALEPAVSALERSGPPTRLNGEVLVLRARRAIEEKREMTLEELVSTATRELVEWVRARKDPRPGSPEEQAAQLKAAALASEPLCRLIAALAHYGADWRLVRDALSRLLGAAAARVGHDWADPVAVYPAVLAGFTWGVGRVARHDLAGAVQTLYEAGSGESVGELAFPPGSNKRLFCFDDVGGRLKHSPQAIGGTHMLETIWSFFQDWIVRRKEVEDAYDRLDVFVALLSARYGEWWVPRCFVLTDVMGEFSRYIEIFLQWFLPLYNEDRWEWLVRLKIQNPALSTDLGKLGNEEQKRWKHK